MELYFYTLLQFDVTINKGKFKLKQYEIKTIFKFVQ